MSFIGNVKGKVRLESSERMVAGDILKFHPELQSFLDEIEERGWRYLYIETRGTAVAEVDLDGAPYTARLKNVAYAPSFDTSETKVGENMEPIGSILEIDLGQRVIKLESVPEVQMFKINVSTKSFPRAATVDIPKGLVTYLNETFWTWQSEWKNDSEKLSEAREVYEVTKWLIDVKKLRLHESYSMGRYEEVSRLLQGAAK